MKFRAGDLEFNASVVESSQSPSPQTGDPLRTMTIQFRAQKAGVHEAAVAESLQRQSGGLYSVGDLNQPDLEWRVRESNWTYVGSEPWGVNHHVWRIEQVERLACSRLIIGSVELEPYEYVEEVSDAGVVRLAARALISEVDLEKLSTLPDPGMILRVGISDMPRAMSLQYVWGHRADDLAVVVRCEDVSESRLTLANANASVNSLGDLVAILSSKGVFDDTDLAQLVRVRHVRRHVADIDAWPLQ